MLLKRTTLYVTLTLLLTQTPSMRSGSPSHPYNDTNQRSVHRLAKILSHINPPHEQTACTLQSCSNEKIDLKHATPEQIDLFMQDPTNILRLCEEISNGIGRIPSPNLKVLLRNPDLANHIIQHAVDNFRDLSINFSDVLYLIIKNCPTTAQAYIQSQMYNDEWESLDLEVIMGLYPDTIQAFVQPVIDNFSQMCNTQGFNIIRTIFSWRPGTAQAFVQPAIDNFSHMCNNYYGVLTLQAILNELRIYNTPRTFVQAALDNFPQICNHEAGHEILKIILRRHPDTAQMFVKIALKNFYQICNTLAGTSILAAILEHHPNGTRAFIQPAINNFCQICNDYGYITLDIILKYCPDTAQVFAQLMIDKFFQICNNKYAFKIQNIIFKCYPDVVKMFTKQLASDPRFFYPFNNLIELKTQTTQHLSAHLMDKYSDLSSQGFINYQDYVELQKMTKRVIELEYQEQQKERYTFVHAHQWIHHFCQELYTDLWSIINEKPNNYRFTRFKYPQKPSLEAFFAYIQEEQTIRQEIIKSAVGDSYFFRKGYQGYLLCINYALFANSKGSNTCFHVKENYSENPIEIDCNQFLSELHFDSFLTQEELEHIRKQFNELQAEHATLSKYGGGLLLSFTPKLMKKCIYPSSWSGVKKTVKIKGIGETSDPQLILDTLRTTPEKIVNSDKIEFVCVLSHDCALIPDNGLDIYEFNAADQDKLAAWRAKKDTLMAWIKERVDKRRQALTARGHDYKTD